MVGDPALTQAAALAAAAYARCLDFRDWDWLPHLFDADATLSDPALAGRLTAAPTAPLRGPAAIMAGIAERPEGLRTRQVVSNSFAEASGQDGLRAVHYVTIYRVLDPALGLRPATGTTPWLVGHWQDRMRRRGDHWLFTGRTLVPAFIDDRSA